MKYLPSSVVVLALLLGNSCGVRAQTDVTLLAPQPMKVALDELIAGFESQTGDKVKVTVTYAPDSRDSAPWGTRQLVARGETLDVSIMFAPFPEAVASGNIVPKSATTLAGLVLAVTVRRGAPKPDISTPAALKRMLLAAKSISVVDPAQGILGAEANEVLQKLGIAEQLQPKLKIVENSALAEAMVAEGEADLFLGPHLSDSLADGVDLVGGLPRGVSTPAAAVGFVSTHALDPKAAKAFLQFLKSPEAEGAYKVFGMQPAH